VEGFEFLSFVVLDFKFGVFFSFIMFVWRGYCMCGVFGYG